jgi:glycerol-3-phosphate dehydrogenase
MAEDTIDQAAVVGRLAEAASRTRDLKLHGWAELGVEDKLSIYGSDAASVEETVAEKPEWREPVVPGLQYCLGEIIWSIRNEMARTVEDALSRRTRALLLDARGSIVAARRVAEVMSQELKKPGEWVENQVSSYERLASGYVAH